MNRFRKLVVARLGALALLFVAHLTAGAELVTFCYEGVVDSVPASLGDQFSVGMPIHGTYTFDLLAEGTQKEGQGLWSNNEKPQAHEPREPSLIGDYPFAVEEFEMAIGEHVFSQNSKKYGQGDVHFEEHATAGDAYIVVAMAKSSTLEMEYTAIAALQFVDQNGDALNDTHLSSIPA